MIWIVVCGIGSKDRGDDIYGPYIVEHVQLKKVDCGLYPESYLNKIIDMILAMNKIDFKVNYDIIRIHELLSEQLR